MSSPPKYSIQMHLHVSNHEQIQIVSIVNSNHIQYESIRIVSVLLQKFAVFHCEVYAVLRREMVWFLPLFLPCTILSVQPFHFVL